MPKGSGDRTFLHDTILSILNEATPEKPMQKKQIMQRLANQDITLSRTTLDKKLSDLELKGYKLIDVGRKGFYLEKDSDYISDGELRFLIDTVMYSRLIPEDNAAAIIEKLAKLGSGSFEKEMKKRANIAWNLEKDAFWGTIENVERVQKAIFEHRQISCNYIKSIDYNIEYRYKNDIIVNPYELAFSDGKYFLLCSYENEDDLKVLRLDKMDHLLILKTKCVENKALEKVKKEKGVHQYLYNQPELKGGQPIDIDLLCYNEAIYEVYDDFGKQNTRIQTIKPENYDDPDTTLISVRTTREAMKSWAVFHANSIVVVKPQELRDEIVASLQIAQHKYNKTGKRARVRSIIAKSLDEAIREDKIAGIDKVRYMGHSKERAFEAIDISEYDIGWLNQLSLSHCKVCCSDKDKIFPELRSISLMRCIIDNDIFAHFPNLEQITIVGSTIIDLKFLRQTSCVRSLQILDCENITDISPVFELNDLRSFETNCDCFDESTAEKLHTKFSDCKISVYDKSLRGENGTISVRPAFYVKDGKVVSRNVSFERALGISAADKKRSVVSLHEMLIECDSASNPLEVSINGKEPLGIRLGAFNLRLDGHAFESVVQSSKIFTNGGPYHELLNIQPKEAKRDKRIKQSGEVIGFNYKGIEFPTEPGTAFFDYIYINAVKQTLNVDEIKKIAEFTHFTDSEFNPPRSINTQAKSVAIIKLMLDIFGEIPELTIDEFIKFHKENVLV
ncbi:DarT1-associated NADAR antitoxin family protein [Ruminococcus flavefaciens]|uniref:DarT1-associated NADAR antitoxin family protein n=1 Tax=Ruminococcus flavefaciens TaxID=1265 RepID=UPI000307B430|nr:WYL domain-containing protein [Ruminococcus flavefaciens]